MYFINITDSAEEDIVSVLTYIANILKVPVAINNLLDEIEKHEEVLENTPQIYPFVSDEHLAEKGLKFVIIENYVLFYITDECKKTVTVIRFLYRRKYWKTILNKTDQSGKSPSA